MNHIRYLQNYCKNSKKATSSQNNQHMLVQIEFNHQWNTSCRIFMRVEQYKGSDYNMIKCTYKTAEMRNKEPDLSAADYYLRIYSTPRVLVEVWLCLIPPFDPFLKCTSWLSNVFAPHPGPPQCLCPPGPPLMNRRGCFQVEVWGGGAPSLSELGRRSQWKGAGLPWWRMVPQPGPEGGARSYYIMTLRLCQCSHHNIPSCCSELQLSPRSESLRCASLWAESEPSVSPSQSDADPPTFRFSHRQWREDGVTGIVQLVVRDGCVQIRRLLHRLRRETKLTLFIQNCQLTPTTTEQINQKQQTDLMILTSVLNRCWCLYPFIMNWLLRQEMYFHAFCS